MTSAASNIKSPLCSVRVQPVVPRAILAEALRASGHAACGAHEVPFVESESLDWAHERLQ